MAEEIKERLERIASEGNDEAKVLANAILNLREVTHNIIKELVLLQSK